MRELCRQGQAEVVGNSRDKIHQTRGLSLSGALYCDGRGSVEWGSLSLMLIYFLSKRAELCVAIIMQSEQRNAVRPWDSGTCSFGVRASTQVTKTETSLLFSSPPLKRLGAEQQNPLLSIPLPPLCYRHSVMLLLDKNRLEVLSSSLLTVILHN